MGVGANEARPLRARSHMPLVSQNVAERVLTIGQRATFLCGDELEHICQLYSH